VGTDPRSSLDVRRIVRLRPGDIIPADAKLVSEEFSVDQSGLPGESLAVDNKPPGDLLYSGSVVRRGEAMAVVILTGTRTYLGRTTELVQCAQPKLHRVGSWREGHGVGRTSISKIRSGASAPSASGAVPWASSFRCRASDQQEEAMM
jgi:magnesium-transporting ATPase (P-type)